MSRVQRGVAARRLLIPAAVAGFVIVLAGMAVLTFQSELPSQTVQPTPSTAPCTPQPCASIQGYELWISGVTTDGPLVTMQVSFRNSSRSTHAEPEDFTLIDSAGRSNRPRFDSAACAHWPRTEFHDGQERGPFPLCFKPFSTQPPLRLNWEPDFGAFCCQTEVRLPAPG